jgi:ferredoxin
MDPETGIILKKDFGAFIERLLSGYRVVGPVETRGRVCFRPLASGSEAALDYDRGSESPKSVVMPRLETLISTREGDDAPLENLPSDQPVVLLGARPCDARALLFLDRVFLQGEKIDPYYARRRNSLLVVTLACSNLRETCFCMETGGSPFSTEGSDVRMLDLGEAFFFSGVTPRGAAFLRASGLEKAGGEHLRRAAELEAAAAGTTRKHWNLSGLGRGLMSSFDDDLWSELTEKCVSCGICAFVCPTCHCFDITDEEGQGLLVRSRVWDTCQFPGFTAQASGFNPRPTFRERFRQRILHKFSYCVDRYGLPGCVGCGRCVESCPVNLDIRSVVKRMASGGGEE